MKVIIIIIINQEIKRRTLNLQAPRSEIALLLADPIIDFQTFTNKHGALRPQRP